MTRPRAPGLTARAAAPGERRGLSALVLDLADGSAEFVRQETHLLRLELRNLLEAIARASFGLVVGSMLLLLGGLAVVVGLVWLVAQQWIGARYWLAAPIVLVGSVVVAVVAGSRGARLLSRAQSTPTEALATRRRIENG